VLLGVAEGLVQDRHRQRLELLRHLDAVPPVDLERQPLVLAAEPVELRAQGTLLDIHQRASRGPDQRLAEVAEGGLDLRRAALLVLVRQRTVRAERQRDAEEPLGDTLVHLAGQVDPLR
jgi:hypothetical protein